MDLYLTIPGEEFFDQESGKFFRTNDTHLVLRHTLVSVSKWEAKYERTFLSENEKTRDEIFDYIRMMSQTPIDDAVFSRFTDETNEQVVAYIQKKHSASRLMQRPQPEGNGRKEKVTSELMYYWMVALNIPWEAQYWHLERLLTLVEIIQRKNEAASAKSNRGRGNSAAMAKQRRAMGAANRARYGSTG